MKTIAKNTIFTNVASRKTAACGGRGSTARCPTRFHRLEGPAVEEGLDREGRHPNSRFTAPASNNPMLSAHVNDPRGVPISAIIFGGRRSNI